MTAKQLALIVGVTTVLALALAWFLESSQMKRFVAEFDNWWEEKNREPRPGPDQ